MILEQLRASLRGPVLEGGDEGYEEARRLYNGMIDKRPRLIARCLDAADVAAAVRYGRDADLVTAIRGGGHNGGGLGSGDDGLVIEHAARMPPGLSQAHIYPIDGAAHRVGKNETAFSYRDANFALVIVGVDPDPSNRDAVTQWCRGYFDAVHPYSAGGAYVNFMMDEGQDRVNASFRDNYARLAKVKRRYDPSNFFRVNQNIRPA